MVIVSCVNYLVLNVKVKLIVLYVNMVIFYWDNVSHNVLIHTINNYKIIYVYLALVIVLLVIIMHNFVLNVNKDFFLILIIHVLSYVKLDFILTN